MKIATGNTPTCWPCRSTSPPTLTQAVLQQEEVADVEEAMVCLHLKVWVSIGKRWRFHQIVVPQNEWFISYIQMFLIENSMKMDDLGVPHFQTSSQCGFQMRVALEPGLRTRTRGWLVSQGGSRGSLKKDNRENAGVHF